MRADARPRFDPARFLFFRRELAGYATAISPGDPSKALRVLNPTTMEIAELCDGGMTVAQIKRQFAARYQRDPDGMLGSQVDEALLMLSLYNLLTVEGVDEPRPAADPTPTVRRLAEWDLGALRLFLGGGSFPQKENPPVIHFRHPYVTIEMYAELLLRMRIFHQKEHFYALLRGDLIEFVLSLFDERPLKPVASIALVVGIPAHGVRDGVTRVFPEVERDLQGRVDKLEWRYVTDGIDRTDLSSALEELGFRLEATIPDEFGPGRDEKVLGKSLQAVRPPSPGGADPACQPETRDAEP